MSNEEKYVIKLIRHGESLKVFPGSENLTPEQMEWLRPLNEEAMQQAVQLGKDIGKFCWENLSENHVDYQVDYPGAGTIGDFLLVNFVHSGRERSKQTVQAIKKGLRLDISDLFMSEDFDLGYILDERYIKAAKQAAKSGDFPTTTDFFLAVEPEKFFREQRINDPSRTYSARQMQENMRGVLKRAVEKSIFTGYELGIMVGHEPVLSLCMVDLTGKPIMEVGGKFNELESVTFTAHKEKGLPTTVLNLRGQEYDVSNKLY